jgi:hypothetical protein
MADAVVCHQKSLSTPRRPTLRVTMTPPAMTWRFDGFTLWTCTFRRMTTHGKQRRNVVRAEFHKARQATGEGILTKPHRHRHDFEYAPLWQQG